MLTRRGLLTGLLGALATPAIVRADNLMRVRGIIIPRPVYSFSAWVRADEVPATVEMSLDGVVARQFKVISEWTRVNVVGEGRMPTISMSPGSSVQAFQAQLERA